MNTSLLYWGIIGMSLTNNSKLLPNGFSHTYNLFNEWFCVWGHKLIVVLKSRETSHGAYNKCLWLESQFRTPIISCRHFSNFPFRKKKKTGNKKFHIHCLLFVCFLEGKVYQLHWYALSLYDINTSFYHTKLSPQLLETCFLMTLYLPKFKLQWHSH